MEGIRSKIRKNWKQKSPTVVVTDRRCPKPTRLVVTDKKTNVQFLIAPDAQVSLFPKFLVSENSEEIDQSEVLVNNSGSIIHTFGQITREIELGLGKLFSWKFTLVGFERPIIGRDFLSHFRLKINFEKMCVENPETGLQTTRISTVACECHRNENTNDGWPLGTAIFKRNVKHRNHITDKISKIPFLIGGASQISVFPKSKLRGETLIPFDGSFELRGVCDDVQILGWTTRKLDFGTGRVFTWKFAVIESGMPIIGLDFLHKVGLVQQLKMGYFGLFDTQTKISTPAPVFPCGCGNRLTGWPLSTLLVVELISKSVNQRDANSDPQGNSRSVQSKPETSSQIPGPFRQYSGPSRQNPTPFDQNSRNHNHFRGFHRNLRPFRRHGSRKPGFQFRKPKKENDQTNHKAAEKKNSSKENKSDVKHRFHVDDKKSKLPFLIGSASEISVFPKSKVKDENLEPFDGSFELTGGSKETVPVLGWTTRTLDIGLTRNFRWKFAVVNVSKPILGMDFISHYGFSIGGGGLIDPETDLTTPPPSGPCDCGKVPDGWPSLSCLTKKPHSGQSKSETQKEGIGKSETESGGKNKIKHRLHVDDKNSKLPFLIGSAAEISVFPKSEVQEEDLEPFDGSFELDCGFGEPIQILGWTTRTLDIGLTRSFTWKFGVIDINKPIIGVDFIIHYRFLICDQGLVDEETNLTTPPPSGPCDCGKVPDGWPTVSILTKIPVSRPIKSKTSREKCGSSETDSEKPKEEPKPESKEDISHRFHVNDKNSKLPFLIGSAAAVSVFPKSEVEEDDLEPFDGSFVLKGASGEVVPIFGWTTRTLDIGLKRNCTWKFAVIDISKPILGQDFLGHYRFAISGEGLIDSETNLTIPRPTGPCDCGKIPDGWPSVSLFKKIPTSHLSETKTEEESDTSKESEMPKEDHQQKDEVVEVKTKSDVYHRFHVDDKNSKLSFLISNVAEVSVFPKSKVKEEELEPFDGSFELAGAIGKSVPVLGWTTRTLDIGLTNIHTWKFAVIDIGKPILGMDFISHYGFSIVRRGLMDSETKLETPPPSGPCDCGKDPDGWPIISYLRKKSLFGRPKSETQEDKTESSEQESDTSEGSQKFNEDSQQKDEEPEKKTKHEINHRFHLLDKNSKILFFVSVMAQVSVFPRSQLQGRSIQVPEGSEIIDCVRLVFPVYGYITLKVDFGLEREFEWKFAVVESSRPIIGLDFLKNFDLKTDYGMDYPSLFDPETKLKTAEFTGSCNCGDCYDFPISTILRKSDSNSERFPVQEKYEITNTRCADEHCPQEKRIILVERETQMPYLLSGAAVSVFPKSKAKEEKIEPFDDSFNLINAFGSVVPIYGWITRKLDFGLGRYLMWKFAVINIGRPMISNDFLFHCGFTVDFEDRSVFDYVTSKTVIGSTEFCECQAKCYWPDISTMEKRVRKERCSVSTDSTEMKEF